MIDADYIASSLAEFSQYIQNLEELYDQAESDKTQLLEALNHLVNTIPVPEIELARSAWGNTNVACVLEAREKAVQALAAAKGQDND